MGFETDIKETASEMIEILGGEDVIYKNEQRAVERQIKAIVDEGQPEDIRGVPHGQAPVFIVSVKNDSTEGISSDELDLGMDLIGLTTRFSDDLQYRKIAKILKMDAGMMTLMVR